MRRFGSSTIRTKDEHAIRRGISNGFVSLLLLLSSVFGRLQASKIMLRKHLRGLAHHGRLKNAQVDMPPNIGFVIVYTLVL